jgi:hypothetical protein
MRAFIVGRLMQAPEQKDGCVVYTIVIEQWIKGKANNRIQSVVLKGRYLDSGFHMRARKGDAVSLLARLNVYKDPHYGLKVDAIAMESPTVTKGPAWYVNERGSENGS